MAKYIVQAVRREGFNGAWRAQREWSHDPTEVEVLDQEEDPMVEVVDNQGKKRQAVHPTRLGQRSWGELMKDGRLSKTPVDAINAAALEAELARLRRRLAELEGELGAAQTKNQALEQQMTERAGPQPDSPVPFDEGGAIRRKLGDELPPRAAGDSLAGKRGQAEAFTPPVVAERPVAPPPPATEPPAQPPAGPAPREPVRVNVPAGERVAPAVAEPGSRTPEVTQHSHSPEIPHGTGQHEHHEHGKKGSRK
jgi:hypothetical protein